MTRAVKNQNTIQSDKEAVILLSIAPLIPALPMLALLIAAILKNKNNFLSFTDGKGFYVAGIVICAVGLVAGLIVGFLLIGAEKMSNNPLENPKYEKYLETNTIPKMLGIFIATNILSILGLVLFPLALRNYGWSIQVLNGATILGAIVAVGFIGMLIYSVVDLIRFNRRYKIQNGENEGITKKFTHSKVEFAHPKELTEDEVERRLKDIKRFNERDSVCRDGLVKTFDGPIVSIVYTDCCCDVIFVSESSESIPYKMQGGHLGFDLGSAFYNSETSTCLIDTKYGMKMFDIDGDTYTDTEGQAKATAFTDKIDRILGVSRVIEF